MEKNGRCGTEKPRQSQAMRKPRRRGLLALAVVAVLAAGACLHPATGARAAATTLTVDGIVYELDASAKTAVVAGYDEASFPSSGAVSIPASVSFGGVAYSVTALGDNCFWRCTALKGIEIPAGVTSLGDTCFSQCNFLKSVEIPAGVVSLGEQCFYQCNNLESIVLPDSVRSLGESCFARCTYLKSVNIPAGVASLSISCFSGCGKLESIVLPDSVTSLGDSCFSGCSTLKTVTVPSAVTSLGERCFASCDALAEIAFASDAVATCAASAFDDGPEGRKFVFEAMPPDAVAVLACVTVENSYYRVRFLGEDGLVIQYQDLKPGETASEPPTDKVPWRASNGDRFAGWDSDEWKSPISSGGVCVKAVYVPGLDKATIEPVPDQVYDGTAKTPLLNVRIGDKELTGGYDYILSYAENVEVGTATITITGAADYKVDDPRTTTFRIVPAGIAQATVAQIPDQSETGQAVCPKPVVKVGAVTLVEGMDYTVSYRDNVKAGAATVVVRGMGNYTGTKTAGFEILAVWKRLAGGSALTTMKAIVNAGWTSSEWAIVATSEGYHDALSASGLAGLLGAPVLLTSKNSLSNVTKNLIKSKKVKKVVVVGGTEAVSAKAFSQIKALGVSVKRVAGGTAASTARAVYREGLAHGGWGSDAVLATSKTYQDALSIAPYSYAKHAPILLTEPNKTTLGAATVKVLNTFSRTIIVGGEAAVTGSAGSQVSGTVRLGGGTAYGTCRTIAAFCLANGMTAAHMGVATGRSYQDALAGAALCGKDNSILVLADSTDSKNVKAVVKKNKPALRAHCHIFGGTEAVSAKVCDAIVAASK